MKNLKIFSLVLFIGLLFAIGALAQERVKVTDPIIIFGQEKTVEQAQQQVQKNAETKPEQPIVQPEQNAEEIKSSKQQLPENYEEILAQYGKWIEDEELGMIWVPNENETKDWKPYEKGRWRDNDNECSYWSSYEPFGYIAYHYGWWQWGSAFGWYWIPGNVWGPAWVNWYWYGNYAYWSPMWYSASYYNQYYAQCYAYSNSRAWTGGITRNQLKSPNLARVVRAQNQSSPVQIATNQVRPNIRTSSSLQIATRPTQNANLGIQTQQVKSYPASKPTQNRLSDSPWSSKTPPHNTVSQKQTAKYVGGLADSPFRNDLRSRAQSNPRSNSPIRSLFGPSRSFSSPRVSSTSRPSANRSSAVHSSGASRTTSAASRPPAPRTTSSPSRGGSIRRK